jgi:hypothetical protein
MGLYAKSIPSTASPEKCRDQDPIGVPWNAQQEETYHDAKSGQDHEREENKDVSTFILICFVIRV